MTIEVELESNRTLEKYFDLLEQEISTERPIFDVAYFSQDGCV